MFLIGVSIALWKTVSL